MHKELCKSIICTALQFCEKDGWNTRWLPVKRSAFQFVSLQYIPCTRVEPKRKLCQSDLELWLVEALYTWMVSQAGAKRPHAIAADRNRLRFVFVPRVILSQLRFVLVLISRNPIPLLTMEIF